MVHMPVDKKDERKVRLAFYRSNMKRMYKVLHGRTSPEDENKMLKTIDVLCDLMEEGMSHEEAAKIVELEAAHLHAIDRGRDITN